MKKVSSILLLIIILLMTISNGIATINDNQTITYSNNTCKYIIDSQFENTFNPNELSCYPMLNHKNTGLKKVSIEAEDAGGIISNLGSNIGPLWLSRNPVQFTIYEGETEIKINGETQMIADFPVHVLLFNFYGFGSTVIFRQSESIKMFGFCRNIVLTPYSEHHLTMHDQPLFTIDDLDDLGQCARGLTSADFNDDGWVDFAVSSETLPWGISTILIFYNIGNKSFTRNDVYQEEELGIEDLASGDFDGDGDIDFMFTLSETMGIEGGLMMKTNGTVNLLFNDGEGNFGDVTMIARHCSEDLYSEFGRFNPQLTTGDYDMDGDIDFLVGDNSGVVEYYINDGHGHFSSDGIIHDFGAISWGLTSYDFDDDGDKDVVVASGIYQIHGNMDGCVYFLQNMIQESNSSMTFNQGEGEKLMYYSSMSGGACIHSIEYNNDGKKDLILGANAELTLGLRTNDSFEFFPMNQFSFEKGFNDIRLGGLTVSDYNNDGRQDLISGGVCGIVRMLWNNYSEFLPPLLPKIIQPTDAEYDSGELMEFGFLSHDVNGNNLLYQIDWGDGAVTDWVGPYSSDQQLDLTHIWDEEGGYWIRANAKNTHGFESGWSKYRLILVDN